MVGVLALESWSTEEAARVESYAGLQLDVWIIGKLISHSIEKKGRLRACVFSPLWLGKWNKLKILMIHYSI